MPDKVLSTYLFLPTTWTLRRDAFFHKKSFANPETTVKKVRPVIQNDIINSTTTALRRWRWRVGVRTVYDLGCTGIVLTQGERRVGGVLADVSFIQFARGASRCCPSSAMYMFIFPSLWLPQGSSFTNHFANITEFAYDFKGLSWIWKT